MLLRRSALLLAAAAASSVHAFKDSAPFVMFTQANHSPADVFDKQVDTTSNLQTWLLDSLLSCTPDDFILIQQPGLKASDLRIDAMPHLQRLMGQAKLKSSVAEVLGEWDVEREFATKLGGRCQLKGFEQGLVSSYVAPALSGKMSSAVREEKIKDLDNEIDQIISRYDELDKSYTVILTGSQAPGARGTPEDHQDLPYEMDEPYPSPMHTDLKRSIYAERAAGNATNLPLFETYQFLTPALFMGLTVSLLLIVILYVGVSAIAGLQVSYAAFSKEMGPQAQKKQQ